MHISVAVVAEIAFLRDLNGIFERHLHGFLTGSAGSQNFHAVDSLSYVSAARPRNIFDDAVFNGHINAVLVADEIKRASDGFFDVLARNGLELEHRRTAEDRGINVKIGIFGG